ncbi:MAG: hypothetical protein U0P45_05045 [Acidimicrobiales bacterium]
MARPAARRLRGELRRYAHPAVPFAMAVVAAGVCAAQHQAAGSDPRPPSPIDLTGSLRIAIEHHSTAFGFFLMAVAAGISTAHDARDGALGQAIVAGGPPRRVWARRMVALLVLAAASTAVSAVAVHLTRGATACRPACPDESRSSASSVITDLGSAALPVAFAASLAVALAARLRSDLLTVAVAVTLFVVPANLVATSGAWLLPATWVARTMQSSPYGYGVDYIGGISPAHHRDAVTIVAAAVLLAATASCGTIAIRAIEAGGAHTSDG